MFSTKPTYPLTRIIYIHRQHPSLDLKELIAVVGFRLSTEEVLKHHLIW